MNIQSINLSNQSVIQNDSHRTRSSSWSTIANIVNRCALPCIILFAMSNIPGVSAGPMAYGICVEACFIGAGVWCPPLIPVCVAACLPALTAPTP